MTDTPFGTGGDPPMNEGSDASGAARTPRFSPGATDDGPGTPSILGGGGSTGS